MFKISIVETRGQRRLVLEGTLIHPWTAEVERAWKDAGEQRQGRKLIVDLSNVTLISEDGKNTLFNLMREGARFSCRSVLTKHVLKQLARRCRCAQ
jgi:anti-anti-sigma regulatory factor